MEQRRFDRAPKSLSALLRISGDVPGTISIYAELMLKMLGEHIDQGARIGSPETPALLWLIDFDKDVKEETI